MSENENATQAIPALIEANIAQQGTMVEPEHAPSPKPILLPEINTSDLQEVVVCSPEPLLARGSSPLSSTSPSIKSQKKRERSRPSSVVGKSNESFAATSQKGAHQVDHAAEESKQTRGLNTDQVKEFYLRHTPKRNIDQVAHFWEKYNKAADFEDGEFVEAQGGNLDTLLIFAGLFAGVNTAFVLEAMKAIQPDQGELTSHLLRSVIHVLQNTTDSGSLLYDEPFRATPRSVRCTTLFFASLCCSLAAAFGAVLGKQWLNRYKHEGALKPPPTRARERQRKFEGCKWWRLEGVVETLPTLLQVSLFLFLVGLVDFLNQIHAAIAKTVMGLSLVLALFYALTTAIATISPTSPYQTRLSSTIRQQFTHLAQTSSLLSRRISSFLERITFYLQSLVYSEIGLTIRVTLYNKLSHLALFIRPLWVSTLPARSRLYTLIYQIISQLKFFIHKIWHTIRSLFVSNPAGESLPPAMLLNELSNPSVDDELLNLRCMVFSMQRVVTLQDIGTLLPALDVLVQNLKIDQTHPIAPVFAHTIIYYVLKPIIYTADKLDGNYDPWGDADIDFRYLLRVLHLLSCRWSYSIDVSYSFGVAVGAEFWATFARDPLDADTLDIILELMDAPYALHRFANGANESLDLIGQHLQRPTSNPELYLSHISLLAQLPRHQNAHLVSHVQPARSHFEPEDTRTIDALVSTMWTGMGPDLDYRRSWLRVHILPTCIYDPLVGQYFARYLLLWFNEHVGAKRDGQLLSVQWPYLEAVANLLRPNANSGFWITILEQSGHLDLLLQIGRGQVPSLDTWEVIDRQANALAIFIRMWNHDRSRENLSEQQPIPPEYLTPYAVQTIVDFWSLTLEDETLEEGFLGDWAGWMELTVSYFEAASRLNLLTRAMEPVVEGYKRNGDGFGRYANDRARERYQEKRLSLFDRMDQLRFID